MGIEYEEQFVICANPMALIVPNQMITIILKPQNGTPTSIRRIIPTAIMAEIFFTTNIIPLKWITGTNGERKNDVLQFFFKS